MDYLRTKVSGKKHRYIDSKYNLDLTYVTPRIIAMAFPGSGIKSLYRNDIEDVANFLKEKHNNHFLIFNLSGVKYDNSLFGGNVLDYDTWPDHYPPPLELLFILVEKIHTYLTSDIKNVIVVNCNAGKGRTGTLICTYLLYSGMFNTPQDAFDYYSLKRFNKGIGVTHAGQQRYVKYFFDIIQSKNIPIPKLRYINKIEISCYPFYNGSSFHPQIKLYKKNTKIIGKFERTNGSSIKINSENENSPFCFNDRIENLPVSGDLLLEMSNETVQPVSLGRCSFHISFIEKDANEYEIKLPDLDPYKFPIKNKVKENYSLKLYFNPYCQEDKDKNNYEDYCENCKKLLWEEIAEYKHISEFLNHYHREQFDSKVLLFGEEKDDVEATMTKRNLLSTPKVDRREKEEQKLDNKCYIF